MPACPSCRAFQLAGRTARSAYDNQKHTTTSERTHPYAHFKKVVLEWDYIMLCAYVKIFDLLVGLWLWIGLGWSWSEDRDYSERHSIRMLLVAVTTVQTLTDVW